MMLSKFQETVNRHIYIDVSVGRKVFICVVWMYMFKEELAFFKSYFFIVFCFVVSLKVVDLSMPDIQNNNFILQYKNGIWYRTLWKMYTKCFLEASFQEIFGQPFYMFPYQETFLV
jgi:hypothetical protein